MNNNHKMADTLKTLPDLNPDVDIAADLAYKKNYMANSFFATGRFASKGHVLTYLLHTMALTMPGPFGGKPSDYWQSPDSGKGYPMTLQIKIPELDAQLTVRSVMDDQELFFSKKENALNHYEGASTFTGIYRGQPDNGYCCLELLGSWS